MARVISVFVQVQYRTLILGIIANTIYLVLAIVCGWGIQAWWAVVLVALLATVYTALGGLKSVAITDALQTIVMVIASLVLFVVVWRAIGGWGGARGEARRARRRPATENAPRRPQCSRGQIVGRD